MRMSDFVVREAIQPELTATTKEAVIREMVESLRAAGYFKGGETEDIEDAKEEGGVSNERRCAVCFAFHTRRLKALKCFVQTLYKHIERKSKQT